MTYASFLITLAIFFVILLIIFKIANTILKVLLGVVVIALVFVLIMQGNTLYEGWKGVTEQYIPTNDTNITIPTTDNITEEQCTQLGGMYGPQGKGQRVFCNLPTTDANKQCNDSADCERLCLYNETSQTGYCQPYQSKFGCFSTVQNGTQGPTLCVD